MNVTDIHMIQMEESWGTFYTLVSGCLRFPHYFHFFGS